MRALTNARVLKIHFHIHFTKISTCSYILYIILMEFYIKQEFTNTYELK